MNLAVAAFIVIALLFFSLALFHIFSAPLRLLLRLGLNTGLGFLALILLDLLRPVLDLHIAVNLINALVVGVLGLPGLALLLLLQWVLLL